MRKLVIVVLFAALGARAEESVTNGLEEASAPIVWCFANYGLDENGDMIPAGLATLKLELDAKYMFTKHIGIFAKVAYCQNIDPNLCDASDLAGQDPDGDVYGRYNEFAWDGISVSF